MPAEVYGKLVTTKNGVESNQARPRKGQACGGKFAAVGAGSWCPAIPDETPTDPGRRLTKGPAFSSGFEQSHAPAGGSKVSMARLTRALLFLDG